MTLTRVAGLLLALLVVGLVAGPGPGTAVAGVAGFTVTTTLDDPASGPLGDGICDTGEGVCSLRAAIQELNQFGGNHAITVPAGTYSLSFGAVGEDAAATGDLDLTAASLSIEGAGAGTTIIQHGFGTHRLFDVHSGQHTISGVTIQNGQGDGADGGGIRIVSGSLTLRDTVVKNNTAGGVGGGIHNSGTLSVVRSTISGNNASAGTLGGGISNDFSGTLAVADSTISGNTAGALGLGGGIRTRGPVTMVNSTVSGNTGSDGAGISVIDPGTGCAEQHDLRKHRQRASCQWDDIPGEHNHWGACGRLLGGRTRHEFPRVQHREYKQLRPQCGRRPRQHQSAAGSARRQRRADADPPAPPGKPSS